MEITFNGKAVSVAARTITELLQEMGIDAGRMALERNLQIVPRRLWAETQLASGDRIEVVQFVGGGRG